MESLAYVIIYFLKGKLPWQNIQGKEAVSKRVGVVGIKPVIELVIVKQSYSRQKHLKAGNKAKSISTIFLMFF